MADPGAVVHIVGFKGRPGKLLHQIVLLIGAAGGGERPQSIGAVSISDLSEPPGDQVQSLIPGCRLELAVPLYQRSGEAVGMVDDLLQSKMAFDAGLTSVYRSIPAWRDG